MTADGVGGLRRESGRRRGADADTFDYVVVGSGAGGGPLAANLARAGMKVLLLEAGTDAAGYNYQVPCFHGHATEDEELRWDFFVRHYASDEQQLRDPKFDEERGGILYPRAGTLGGCTAHNAMITVYPHNQDWDHIAEVTGDRSWASKRMRRYFERLERCRYARRPRAYPKSRLLAAVLRWIPILSQLFGNRARHGFNGWLTTSLADPTLAVRDRQLLEVIKSAAQEALSWDLGRPLELVERLTIGDWRSYFDPNDWRVQGDGGQGVWLIPIATRNANRNGTRDYILQVQRTHPENLVVRTGALATRVLFDGDRRAIGVEYLDGAHAYRADPHAEAPERPVRRASVRSEVIVAGGAFNTPQLLLLSGIGPRQELDDLGIAPVVDLPGVGRNLQDRYEVGVITEFDRDFVLVKDCGFEAPRPGEEPDPCFAEWLEGGGVYSTNGAVLGIVKRSRPERPLPDLFVFGLPAHFSGYYRGYSKDLAERKRYFTWAILKAHTRNSAGTVELRTPDPRDPPIINFRYFGEGNDAAEEDLESMIEGVEFVRKLMSRVGSAAHREVLPGEEVRTRQQIGQFVRDQAWGHHASGTCKMGPASDTTAVVDSRFRVHGTKNLRVVDASVFPRIPGFFIVTAVYMLSEKASNVILADAPKGLRATRRVQALAGAVPRVAAPSKRHLISSPRTDEIVRGKAD
jgi:choline dehydrogenase